MPFNKWIMMTFNTIVDCNKNESTISIYFNDKNIETIKTDFLLIPKKQCKCIINKSNNKQLNPPLLGTFMLMSPLLDKEIINMFNNGQRKLICLSNPPIFAYKPVYDKDVISYIPHHTCIKNTNNKIKVIPYQYIYTFFDLIFNHLDFKILIPIFEHSNKILINGIKIDFNDKIGVKILSNLFNLGKEFQHSFCKSKCFYSLAHYFLIAEDSTITYDLYITYFDLLSSISYEKLQIQLIDVILMNFDLWSKCHIEDRLKIFEHWNAYLYFNYKSLIGSIRPPEWFLYNISNFFNPTNLDDQNYFKCRQIFYFITHKSLISNLTIDHIFLIISLVINKKTLTEKIDMFNFLTSLLFEEILKESNNLDLSNIIQPILLVLNNELMDDIIVKGIITLFIKIHKSNKFKLQIPFDLLIQKIVIELNYHQEFIISIELFKSLIVLMNKNKLVEILPILCFYSINGGIEYLSCLTKEIDKSLDFYVNNLSTIYPTFLIFKYYENKKLYRKIIEMNVLIFNFHLITFINTINIIGNSGYSSEIYNQIRHDVLLYILNSKNYHDDMLTLFEIIRDFIFFRDKKSQSLLFKLSNEFPFFYCANEDEKSFDEINDATEKIDMVQKLIQIITNSINDESNKKFGLRFDEKNHNWLDLDLATKTIDFYKIFIQKSSTYTKEDTIRIKNTMNIIFNFIYYSESNSNKALLVSENTKISDLKINEKTNFEYITKIETEIKRKNDVTTNVIQVGEKVISYYLYLLVDLSLINKLHEFHNIYQEHLNNFESNHTKLKDNIENEYSILFDSLTKCRYAWSELKQQNSDEKLKRENTLCSNFCPFKIHKNESHTNEIHKDSKKSKNLGTENLKKIGCKLIKIKEEKDAIFQMNYSTFFITTKNKTIVINSNKINSIQYIFKENNFCGIHILTKSGKTFYLLFNVVTEFIDCFRSYFLTNFLNYQQSELKSSLNNITNCWIDGKISNFEYLMHLNTFSGRSFNNIDQYPVFPWILTDYKSLKIDLKDPSIYRDLSKPIGAINNKRLNEIKSKNSSYLYESGYSNQYSVLFWLYRLEPFYTKHQNIQKNDIEYSHSKFDSINDAFNDATTKMNDYRELIPEFFFFPEFLTSEKIGDVTLPPWANKSPFEFIYMHRKALESEIVSFHLHEWVDLIWGYKQDSHEVNNVFSPSMSELKMGQIPFKLFNEKHPIKKLNCLSSNDNSDLKYFNILFRDICTNLAGFVSVESEKSFLFKLVGHKNVYFYSIDLSSIKSIENEVKPKLIKNIFNIKCEHDENDTIQKDGILSMINPIFINSNLICFIDESYKKVKIVNCQNWTIEEIKKPNFKVVSIDTNSEGLFAISSTDSSVTLYNANLLNISKQITLMSNQLTNLILPSFELYSSFFPSMKEKMPIKQTDSGLMATDNNNNNTDLGTLYSYKDLIICSAISQTFKLFVCGTNSNNLIFCQLNLDKMKINKIVEISGKPNKIIITENFGFVVVSSIEMNNGNIHQNLTLFNVNGEKNRELKCGNEISFVDLICVSSSPGGFDYIIAGDEENRIFVFEAFYLDLGEPIFTCHFRIKNLNYIKEKSAIIVFSDVGIAYVIIHPIIDE